MFKGKKDRLQDKNLPRSNIKKRGKKMNELMVKEFGTKEVRWSNNDKVNLVDVAKCLGLTRVNNQGSNPVVFQNVSIPSQK